MALSGTISKAITGRTYKIEWSATQDVAGNYSTITCKHYLVNSATYSLNINSRSNTCTVGGVSASYTSPDINTSGGSTISLGTTTHKVSHNSDGTKSVTIKGVFNIQATLSGTYVSSITASGTVTLNAIPRSATITNAPNFTNDDNPTIKYSNPLGNAVEELMACISSDGSSADLAAYRSIEKTGTSYTFELTAAERAKLVALCSNKTSAQVKFFVRTTYNGTYYYHSVWKTFTLVGAENGPTLNPTVRDVNSTTTSLTGNASTRFVRGYSNVQFSVGATATDGATIVSQGVRCGDQSIDAASGTLQAVESAKFEFYATDSRGITSTATIEGTLVDYVPLTCYAKVSTPTASGSMTIDVSGNFFNGSFGSRTNSLTVRYRLNGGSWTNISVSKSGNTYSGSVTKTGLDYQTAYTVEVQATDSLMTVTGSNPAVRATPVFDWSEDDFKFNVPVYAEEALHANGGIYVDGELLASGGVTLYESTSGTTGNVTLSESAANFSYLDIECCYADGVIARVERVYDPNGRTVDVSALTVGTNGANFSRVRYAISGKTMTASNNNKANLLNDGTFTYGTNNLSCTRVVGYR